ncbi:MAG: LysM peptidoglycan-binding domain-containing protein [Patescibacteria group bacterium]
MRGWKTVLFVLIALCVIATNSEARTYTIQPGDTPSEIAGKFTPSLEELRAANPRTNFSVLSVGDKVVDPRPEPAELRRLEGEVARLKGELGGVTKERDDHVRELAASHGLNDTLDGKVAELEPLANQAESYRDRFWSWVVGLAVAFVLALIDIAWQARVRRRLDRKIINFQQEVARARADGVMAAAASRAQTASRPARANGADTGAHHPH